MPGVATGLAVTGAGGDVLFVEASLADPKLAQPLTLTGQLGDVMKESAQIALSFLRLRGAELELPVVGDLKDRGVAIHFPAGAVPEDGRDAGVITMTTALASLSGRLVRTDVAMTGEVGFARPCPAHRRGEAEAARRAPGGITTVIIQNATRPTWTTSRPRCWRSWTSTPSRTSARSWNWRCRRR